MPWERPAKLGPERLRPRLPQEPALKRPGLVPEPVRLALRMWMRVWASAGPVAPTVAA